MNVNLTPDLERIVEEKMVSGCYGAILDVVGEALRLLEYRDRLLDSHKEELRHLADQGWRASQRPRPL